jgi:hypothetical protein
MLHRRTPQELTAPVQQTTSTTIILYTSPLLLHTDYESTHANREEWYVCLPV